MQRSFTSHAGAILDDRALPAERSKRMAAFATSVDGRATAVGVETIIGVEQVVKTYKSGAVVTHALRGVTLSVPRGEMLAIMGPSGCGKTTLLNCMSGLDTVTAGVIRINGTDLTTLSDNAKTTFRARQMGFIFQFYNLLPVLSAVENVELPMLVSGVRPGEARQRALEALDLVGLADRVT